MTVYEQMWHALEAAGWRVLDGGEPAPDCGTAYDRATYAATVINPKGEMFDIIGIPRDAKEFGPYTHAYAHYEAACTVNDVKLSYGEWVKHREQYERDNRLLEDIPALKALTL